MSVTLADVITAARDRHPLLAKPNVPDAVFGRFLTDYQRTLLSKAVQRDPAFLTQTLSIAFSVSSATPGAGSGVFPGTVTNGNATATTGPIGDAVTVDTDHASTLVSATPVQSATSTTLTAGSVSWSTNAYAGDLVEITAGTGAGQVRSIQSNTATQLTVSQAWATVPDATSLFRVVTVKLTDDETADVVTAFPQTTTRRAFVVRVNAQGTPYLDLTQPLTVSVDAGVALPPLKRLVGGTVRFTSGSETVPLTIVGYSDRFQGSRAYAVWVENGALHLIGDASDWQDVASLELRYVPEPPAFTALTDVVLLPDSARPALVARCAVMGASRVQGLPGMHAFDVSPLAQAADEAEGAWLAEVGAQRRSRTAYVKEVW